MFDLMIQTNVPLFEEDGGAMGGTERQVLTVAEKLVQEGVDVAILHSQTNGKDRIINGVKHLNVYRHYYDNSKVRLFCNHFGYALNMHKGYYMSNPHINALSPIEINSAEKSYVWFHNWYTCHELVPRIFNSKAVQSYVLKKGKKVNGDQVIPYMVPNGIQNIEKKQKRGDYLYWMSAFGKGLKEAVLMYIALYERDIRKPLYISIPPQRMKKDVDIVTRFLQDANKLNYPIRFLGELKYENAMKTLSNAACLFRPTLPQETFGLVYLEANQLGVPVITNEGDAAEEILTDKNNMIIRKNNNLHDIVDWLSDVDNKQVTVNMDTFDPDKVSKQWIGLLDGKK